jgi:hypothetical protein
MGGILWHIALHYGPSGLFASAISAPSTDISLHLHFDHTVDLTMVDDRVTKAEIVLLLGVTKSGSVWPTLDIWERHELWFGEWSAKAKRWFQSHIQQIDTSSHFFPPYQKVVEIFNMASHYGRLH